MNSFSGSTRQSKLIGGASGDIKARDNQESLSQSLDYCVCFHSFQNSKVRNHQRTESKNCSVFPKLPIWSVFNVPAVLAKKI